jgi:hypothetical protein
MKLPSGFLRAPSSRATISSRLGPVAGLLGLVRHPARPLPRPLGVVASLIFGGKRLAEDKCFS